MRDGTLITAGGVTSASISASRWWRNSSGARRPRRFQLTLEYAPAPPFGSGTPAEAPDAVVERAKKRLSGSRAAREAIIGRIT